MSYNDIEINGQLVKGHKGIGGGGVAPTITNAINNSLGTEYTMTGDGLVSVYIILSGGAGCGFFVNNVRVAYFYNANSSQTSQSLIIPCLKGAVLKMIQDASGYVYFGVDIISYS